MFDLGVLLQELSHAPFLDLPLFLAIDLVAHQNEGEFFWFLGCSLVEELCDPGLDVVEGLNGSGLTRLFVMS